MDVCVPSSVQLDSRSMVPVISRPPYEKGGKLDLQRQLCFFITDVLHSFIYISFIANIENKTVENKSAKVVPPVSL